MAPIQYITLSPNTTIAYRRLGSATGVPLVMHMHFRGSMDFWGPSLIAPLMAYRPVILFDQPGVGRSTGIVPTTYQGWADDLIAFVRALDIKQIDLFGFSMGGFAAQMVALTAPELVRKLVLAGTGASAPPESTDIYAGRLVWPREKAPKDPIKVLAGADGKNERAVRHAIWYSFFQDGLEGASAADRYFSHITSNASPVSSGEPQLLDLLGPEGTKRQLAAGKDWAEYKPTNSWDRLIDLDMPVLVLNGDEDSLVPTSHSWELMRGIKNSELVIYPRAGHGFIWQYSQRVAMDVNRFLDHDDLTGMLGDWQSRI